MVHTVLAARHHLGYFFWKRMVVTTRGASWTSPGVWIMLMPPRMNMIGSRRVRLSIRSGSACRVRMEIHASGIHGLPFGFMVMS
ncbi:hypothetical protein EBAPG3_14900 [Nitrosospira lacus]|nr:hypothetical protein EBAPG3_14900 [Nitrosospira lacus]